MPYMPSRFVAMSNAERQRRFRKSHPGYYARLHRKRRGISKAKLRQQKAAAAEQIQAEIKARSRAQAELLAQAKAIVASFNRPPTRLMLPAPTIDPLAAEIAAL